MSTIQNGGPAFPPNPDSQQKGMTLRDYFAAKALQGETACQDGGESVGTWAPDSYATLAKRCYEMADAMLKERGPQ